jgi:hypothetical protein
VPMRNAPLDPLAIRNFFETSASRYSQQCDLSASISASFGANLERIPVT